jgi:hypothetical protein
VGGQINRGGVTTALKSPLGDGEQKKRSSRRQPIAEGKALN